MSLSMSIRAAFFLSLGLASVASAAGSLTAPDALPAAVRADYEAAIVQARRDNPDAFRSVQALAVRVPDLDRTKRGRYVLFERLLQVVAPEDMWALVEVAAFSGPDGAMWTPTARTAWQVGLLGALGAVQDKRLIPLFDTLLSQPSSDFLVLRETAVARGLFGDDAGLAELVSLARASGPHQAAVLAGLGRCRRALAAETIAAAIEVAQPGEQAIWLIDALSDVGNSWVWPRLSPERRVEEQATRQVAAEALVRAFARFDGAERQKASDALMVVDAPGTPALVSAARAKVGADQRAAFDKLAARFAQNPVR